MTCHTMYTCTHISTFTIFRKSRGLARVILEGGENTVPAKNKTQTLNSVQKRLRTMTCSDKIVKWNVLGLQGSLLSLYIEPVYLESIVIGDPSNQDHVIRAFHSRVKITSTLPPSYHVNLPRLLHTKELPQYSIRKSQIVSLNWFHHCTRDSRIEIVHSPNGKVKYDSGPSRLCKYSFVTHFLSLWDLIGDKSYTVDDLRQTTYGQLKILAEDYHTAKDILNTLFKMKLGSVWIGKPEEFDSFTLDEVEAQMKK